MFIAGLLLFSAASLAGGFATSEAWLLAARAVPGGVAGAATIAATALALYATTFPEGPPRNRAMGVYAAMSVAGGAVGLIAGGLLTSYASWRWVLFVNVPIGLAAALLAPQVLPESARQRDRFDLPGAVTTSQAGLAALVYGLSSAATSPDGVSHWGDAKVVVSLAASLVLLAAFAVIETRSEHPILQTRLLRDRDRTGANLIMVCVGAATFGMFFFLTLFMQSVWGYSALKTGLAYLPLTAGIIHRVLRCRRPAHSPRRCRATATDGRPDYGWRPVLAVPARRARQLRRRGARPDAGHRRRPRPAVRAGSPWWPCPRSPMRSPGWRPACATPASRSAARSGWPCSAPSPGPSSPTPSMPRPPAPRPHRPGWPPGAAQPGSAHRDLPPCPDRRVLRAFLVTAGIMLLALVITLVAIRVRRADLGGPGSEPPVTGLRPAAR